MKAQWYSIVCGYHTLTVHSPVSRPSSYFRLLAAVNDAVANVDGLQYLLEGLPLVPLAMCPEVEMLGIVVIPWLLY